MVVKKDYCRDDRDGPVDNGPFKGTMDAVLPRVFFIFLNGCWINSWAQRGGGAIYRKVDREKGAVRSRKNDPPILNSKVYSHIVTYMCVRGGEREPNLHRKTARGRPVSGT